MRVRIAVVILLVVAALAVQIAYAEVRATHVENERLRYENRAKDLEIDRLRDEIRAMRED